MKLICCLAAGLMALLAACEGSQAQPEPEKIITFDLRGGLPPPFPRKNKDPYLVIRANGHATVNDPFERKPRVEAKLSQKEVQELMDFIVRDNAFFSLDSNKIKGAIEAQLKKGHVTDLPTTYIWVKSGGKEHEVRCYALFVYAEKFPDIKPLAQLRAIERRLSELLNKLRKTAETGASPDEHLRQKDLHLFQGSWVAVAGQGADGKPAPKEDLAAMRLTVDGNKFTFTGKDFSISGSFTIDPTKNPKTIDTVLNEDQVSSTQLRGIYEIKGDLRRSCFALPDRERPTRFMDGVPNYVIFEWRPKGP